MTAAGSFTEPCPQCGGTEWTTDATVSSHGPFTASATTTSRPCVACLRGKVPDDGTVEAAKWAIGEAFIKALGWGESKPFAALEVYAIAQEAAHAALVAAARYQSEEKP